MSDDSSEENMPVSRHDLIAEVVERYPEAAEILMDFGIGCYNCHIAEFETLEQGILGHGFSEDELEEVLEQLNEIAHEEGPEASEEEDMEDESE